MIEPNGHERPTLVMIREAERAALERLDAGRAEVASRIEEHKRLTEKLLAESRERSRLAAEEAYERRIREARDEAVATLERARVQADGMREEAARRAEETVEAMLDLVLPAAVDRAEE